jgi:histidine triad (HIT) family protein
MPEELTEEDIRNMSPEQLRQLQKQQCIFCHIISKRVQSRIVYEDDQVMGVLDINPANPGHVLLLPKEHFSVSPQMPDDLVAHMGMIAKGLSKAMLRALGAQGTTILAANGVAAGQRASHFMMHVIPRREGDNVGIAPPQGQVSEEQLKMFTDTLRPVVLKAMGVAETRSIYDEEKAEKAGVPAGSEKEKQGSEAPTQAPKEETTKEKTTEKTQPPKQKPADASQSKQSPEKQAPGSNLDDITQLLLGRGQ